LSVLRSDGQLPAALRAALSSREQRHHPKNFSKAEPLGVTWGVFARDTSAVKFKKQKIT
jgi:hypothetical protein